MIILIPMIKECLHCQKEFKVANWNRKKRYCSHECYWEDKVGKPSSKRRVEKDGKYRCSSCKSFKDKSSYSADKSKFNGLGTTCSDCRKLYTKEYWAKEHVRARANELNVERRRKIRAEIISLLGGKCSKCGFADIRALQIDHVNGGGLQEKKIISPSMYYKHVLNKIKDGVYQLLCSNCNWIKRYENEENDNWRR